MRVSQSIVVISKWPRAQGTDASLAVEWVRVIVRLYQARSAC